MQNNLEIKNINYLNMEASDYIKNFILYMYKCLYKQLKNNYICKH